MLIRTMSTAFDSFVRCTLEIKMWDSQLTCIPIFKVNSISKGRNLTATENSHNALYQLFWITNIAKYQLFYCFTSHPFCWILLHPHNMHSENIWGSIWGLGYLVGVGQSVCGKIREGWEPAILTICYIPTCCGKIWGHWSVEYHSYAYMI